MFSSPVKVVFERYDKQKLQPTTHTFVFVGNVPKNISDAIKAFGRGSTQQPILREYYGRDYAKKLGRHVYGGGGDNDNDKIENIELAAAPEQTNEISLDNIDELLNEKTPLADTNTPLSINENVNSEQNFEYDDTVTYVFDVRIYPEDKISEIYEKIYMASNIPMYRMHVYWIQNGFVSNAYKIYAEGIDNINAREILMSTNASSNMYGLVLNKLLYTLRAELKVESRDQFTLVEDITTFYVVDIATVINPIRAQMSDLCNDVYKFEMFYNGFIIRLWPQMTTEVFMDYLMDESQISQKYPDLSRTRSYLSRMFQNEANIMDHMALNTSRMKDAENKFTSVSITSMIAYVLPSHKISMNIRNLFDKLRVSKCIPQINAYVEYESRPILLKKTFYKNQSPITFPSVLKSGLVVALSLRKSDQDSYHASVSSSTIENEQSRYIFLNILPNGKYLIKSMWNEEDAYGFTDIINIMRKFTDSIIGNINALSKYVFESGEYLQPITKYNIMYQSISSSIYWKKMVNDSGFKYVRSKLTPYISSNIMSIRGNQIANVYEFIFRKCMTEFDTSVIERVLSAASMESMKNQYSRFSNNVMKQKWIQLYEGRVVKMTHRTTDIKFELLNVRESEFNHIHKFLMNFVSNTHFDKTLRGVIDDHSRTKTIKKLKKLRETDPELYNLKKYGSKKVYSILCQNPRQPLVYTQDEIDELSVKEKSKLTKYWNFTLNKEAYYGCPQNKYPHLSFIVGVHPKNFCLPCCGKTILTEESKKKFINKVCVENRGVYTPGESIQNTKYKQKAIDTKSKHIINYGKDIEVGRISKPPQSSMKNLLFNSLNLEKLNAKAKQIESDLKLSIGGPPIDYYVIGVDQNVADVSYVGTLYCIAEGLKCSSDEVINNIITSMNINSSIFNMALGGALVEFFDTYIEFKSVLLEFKKRVPSSCGISCTISKFRQWNELFIELAQLALGLYIIMFCDDHGKGETTDLFISDAMRSEIAFSSALNTPYLIIIKRQILKTEQYYPLMVVKPDLYFKTRNVLIRTFTSADAIIKHIHGIVSSTYSKDLKELNRIISQQLVVDFVKENSPKYKIDFKFINKRNFCYALMVGEAKDEQIYVPIDYSTSSSDGIKSVYTSFNRTQYKVSQSVLEEFITMFNKFIKKNYCINAQLDVYRYLPIQVEKYLVLNNETIGFNSTQNTTWYFNNVKSALTPFTTISYDPDEINSAIATAQTPSVDNRQKLFAGALYTNYIYNLFVLEFVNYVNKERNKELRDKINKIIKKNNLQNIYELLGEIKQITTAVDSDHLSAIITNAVSNGENVDVVCDEIKHASFVFDNITIDRLSKLPHVKIVIELEKIIENFAEFGELDLSKITFPNIYLPCEWEKMDYCSKKKLIVNDKKLLGELTDLLARDIVNPLKCEYMFNGMFSDNIINFFNFETYSTEIISMVKL
jgi:hypothetical protein